ncbi:MAG: hypothetical protein DRR06_18090 [Gammaproteobacteria bacterium]|nr:MAG: hypothetical protein DRR06_18090 [Gammaproteobacteria bacterium]RLA54336.1 MAG: hypothetical protein DRR42_02140 [Gammaproteobacteria bacterium]
MVSNTKAAVKLFTHPNSPFGAKIYWALQYKRAEFDLIYVNPLTRNEIAFTEQGVVPILKVGEAWLQDSSENCLWLDDVYPKRPFSGETDEQREGILEADQWVTDNIVALHFRACIDKGDGQTTKRNARRMATLYFQS